eukprot:scaffold256722_cov35-Tisochrysis_lutea.AAC.4
MGAESRNDCAATRLHLGLGVFCPMTHAAAPYRRRRCNRHEACANENQHDQDPRPSVPPLFGASVLVFWQRYLYIHEAIVAKRDQELGP